MDLEWLRSEAADSRSEAAGLVAERAVGVVSLDDPDQPPLTAAHPVL